MTKIIASLLLFVGLAFSLCDFSARLCSVSGITCPSFSNSIIINGTTYTAADFGVVSFNEMTITHGDIQDRAAVRNNFYGNNGISVADLIGDNKEFSLIVGRSVNWNNEGAIVGNAFVGDSASSTFPVSIAGRVTLGCSTSGCLDSFFDSIQNYWSQFSSNLALQADNVEVSINQEGVAVLNCRASANAYFVRITPESFNTIVGYSVSATCSSSAAWVFNVIGSADVNFNINFDGNPIQVSGTVIYNIAPSTRVTITSSVNGEILAPYANLNMVGGTVTGHIIAANISNIVQVNIPSTCPSGPSSSSASGSTSTSSDSASSSSSSSGSANSDSGSVATTASGAASASSTGTSASSLDGTAIDNTGVVGSNNNENAGVMMSSSIILVVVSIIALI